MSDCSNGNRGSCTGVSGKNVIMYIYDVDVWRLYACATSCSISISTSTVETSTTGSGLWATFRAQKHSWSGSFEGVVNFDANGVFNLYDLRKKQIEMTPLLVRYERTDPNDNVYTDEGTGIIVNSSDSGQVDSMATFSIELQGTGAITQIFDRGDIFDDSFSDEFN